jgi:phage tail sheath gpL-like
MPATKSPSPSYVWAAAMTGANTKILDPSESRKGVVLKGVVPPRAADRLSPEEFNALVRDHGVSSYTVDADNKVRIDKLITMYQVDGNNIQDKSYFRHATMLTLSAIRYTYVYNFSFYNNYKLAPDTAVFKAGSRVMQPRLARSIAIDIAKKMEFERGWITDVDSMVDQFIFTINDQVQGRLDGVLPVNIIQHNDQTAITVQHKG